MDTKFRNKLYFAYGSNLAKRQMRALNAGPAPFEDADGTPVNRCPDSEPVAPFELKGFRLAFVGEGSARWGRGGVATVIPAAGQSVHGAIYRLSASDEAALNAMEGVPGGWYYKDSATIRYDGEGVLMYVATAKYGLENMPNLKYLNRLREGYRDWDLPLKEFEGTECFPAEETWCSPRS